MGRGFDSVSDNSSRDSLRESDLWEIYPLSKKAKGQWTSIRILSLDFLPVKKHWVRIINSKDKTKIFKIPRMCVNFNPDDKAPLRDMACPYCALKHGDDKSGDPAQYDFKWYVQAIARDDQESAPRKQPKHTKGELKSGKKEKDSDSWTPVVVVPLTNALANKIKQLGERNIHKVKDKKTGKKTETDFPINHDKYGCDIEIKYNEKAAAADRYTVERGKHTPLTEDEKAYLTWDFSDWENIYNVLGRLNEKDALEDFKKLDVLGGSVVDGDDEDEDDEDDMSLGKKKKSSKGKKRSLADDDEDEDDDEDDEDEDDRKSKKSKSKKSKSRKLLDDDEDEDDEDEKPKKKKKSSKDKSSSLKKKKSKKSDEDDEDEDEKPKKKKKKASSDEKSSKKKKKK